MKHNIIIIIAAMFVLTGTAWACNDHLPTFDEGFLFYEPGSGNKWYLDGEIVRDIGSLHLSVEVHPKNGPVEKLGVLLTCPDKDRPKAFIDIGTERYRSKYATPAGVISYWSQDGKREIDGLGRNVCAVYQMRREIYGR